MSATLADLKELARAEIEREFGSLDNFRNWVWREKPILPLPVSPAEYQALVNVLGAPPVGPVDGFALGTVLSRSVALAKGKGGKSARKLRRFAMRRGAA